MADNEIKQLENIADIANMLPDFEKGRLFGYAARMVEEREAKEEKEDREKQAE